MNTKPIKHRKLCDILSVRIWILCTLLMLYTCMFSGCFAPTYPKDTVCQSIKEMIKREYGYDVKVRLVGKTLGVYVPLTQILDYDRSMMDSFAKKHNDILLSIRRITTSSDADINFFITIFTDKLNGIKLSFTRSVEDIIRVMRYNISINDYAERMVMHYGYDPVQLAEKTIRKLLEQIPKRHSAVTSYFLSDPNFNETFLFKYLMESELKEDIDYSIISLKTKQISKDKILVYVKLRETFTPKPDYKTYQFLFKSRSIHEFMFEITLLKGFIPLITKTYSFRDKKYGQVITPKMDKVFKDNIDIDKWDDYFYLEEQTWPAFIIEQVATRMNRKIQEADNPNQKHRADDFDFLNGSTNILSMEGEYKKSQGSDKPEKIFQITVVFKETNSDKILREDVKKLLLKYFKRTLKKYSFDDYTHLNIILPDGTVLNSFDKNTIDGLHLDDNSWKSYLRMRPPTNF